MNTWNQICFVISEVGLQFFRKMDMIYRYIQKQILFGSNTVPFPVSKSTTDRTSMLQIQKGLENFLVQIQTWKKTPLSALPTRYPFSMTAHFCYLFLPSEKEMFTMTSPPYIVKWWFRIFMRIFLIPFSIWAKGYCMFWASYVLISIDLLINMRV